MFNITNYFEHPTRPGYYIFKFYEKPKADYFEDILKKEKVWFEASYDDEQKPTYLYGIKLADYKKALKANYLVNARYRKKTISNHYIQLLIYLITIGFIVLAIFGALKSKP